MHGLLPLGGPCEGCNLVKLCTCVDACLQVGISTHTSKVHPHSYTPQVCVHVCTCSCTSHAYPCTHTHRQTDIHTHTQMCSYTPYILCRSSVSKTASLNSHLHIHGHTSNHITCYTFCTRSHGVVAVLKRGRDSGPCNNSLTGTPHPLPGLASIHKGHFTAV